MSVNRSGSCGGAGFFDFTGRVGVVLRFMAAIVKTKNRYSENQKPAIVKTENLLY